MLWRHTSDSQMRHSDAPAATAELKRLRAIDKEREKVHNQKLRGTYVHGLDQVPCHTLGNDRMAQPRRIGDVHC